MLNDNMVSGRNNQFENGKFSSQIWSAPYVVSPSVIKRLLSSFALEGRQIKRMKMIGLAYNLRRDLIEEYAYNNLEGLDEEERQRLSDFNNIDPEFELDRSALIDEPLMIEFMDGDVFEIETPQQPEFRISMNCIPWDILAGTNLPNIDAENLFSPAIGKRVVSVEIQPYHTDQPPMWCATFDEDRCTTELVSCIIIWLENEMGLCIEGWLDFCHVTLIHKDMSVFSIPFKELKAALFE